MSYNYKYLSNTIYNCISYLLFSYFNYYFGNFKTKKDGALKNEIEEKNKYINTLIAEQERQRIGQDLHDTLGHVFVSLSLKSELAYKLIDKDRKS